MGVRETRKEARRAAIEQAGLSGFLERGYDLCSVEQIAADVGIARGTFYLYFDDKHALFEALSARLYEPLVAVLDGVVEQLKTADGALAQQMIYMQMAMGLSQALAAGEDLVALHVRESRSANPAGETVRRWLGHIEGYAVAILEQAVATGQLRAHDPYIAGLAIVGAAERMLWAWFSGDERLDRDTVAAQLNELFWRGIAP
jgi:AcrR family transcriptional regulator